MSFPENTGKFSEETTANKPTATEDVVLTPRQRQKQDALDLAELVYEIFKASESSDRILSVSGKGPNND